MLTATGSKSVWRSHEVALLAATVVVVLLAGLADSQHNYWNNPGDSAREIVRSAPYLGIAALGAAVVIIAGGIDLSIGSMMAFAGTICASVLVLLAPETMNASASSGDAAPLSGGVLTAAIGAALVAGVLVGSLHAWLITALGLPPFIATLATLVGLRSLSRAICGSVTRAMFDGESTQIQIQDARLLELSRNIWIPAAIFLLAALAVWVLLGRTVVGRHLYALGGNEQAARLSGIRTERVKWLAYVLCSLLASIVGIISICDQSVADPQVLGMGAELNAIAAAVVGGCSLAGGLGTVSGTVLGVLFLRCVIDGIAKVIKTGADVYEGLIVGIVLVMAVAFAGRSRGKQLFPGALGWAAIVTLSALAGTLALLMIETHAGGVTAGLALVLLAGVKIWQGRQPRQPAGGSN